LKIREGNYAGALLDVDRASEQYGNASVLWAWRFRVLKAHILAGQSAPQKALDLLHDELPPQLASSDVAVRFHIARGIAYRVAQKLAESENSLRSAERIARDAHPEILCEVLNARGSLEFDEHKYADAEATFQEAASSARQHNRPDQQAYALGNLAVVSTQQEHFDQAIDRGQAATELSQSLHMNAIIATMQGNLGWSYFELGDYDTALEYYKKGAENSERSGLPGYTAYWFAGVADTYMALRNYASAEELAKRTLERARALNNAQTITACLNTLVEIMLRTGRFDEADEYNQEALQMEEQGLDHFGVLESALLSGRIETSKGHHEQAEKLFQRVLQDPKAETPLRWQAEAGLAKLHDDEGHLAQADSEYRKSIDTIEVARRSIDRDDLRLSYLSGGIEFYDDYIEFLIRHHRAGDALRVAELSRARTLAEGLSSAPQAKAPTRVTADRQPQQLAQRSKATLLFYWLGQKHSYLWVITPAKTANFTLPPAPEIDPVIKSYRAALLESRDLLATGNPDGKKLHAMLVEPAKKLIPQGSRVIILPDSSLYGLNFETLIVSEPKPHYWIEDVTLTTASSLTLLASASMQTVPKDKSLFLVGDTIPPNADFPALRQAADEMQRIQKYFPESRLQVLSKNQATPAAYLSSRPEQYAFLHFVTHGTASRARPLESAVILSKEKDEDSYKLYARDIVKRRLSAYLVTISACNGAGTRAYSGEGLVGLSWAFLRAGAHNVVGALWEVNDSAAPQLMDKFYGELSAGKDPAAALRAAKLSLLHRDDVYKKPLYWAPFQLYAGS